METGGDHIMIAAIWTYLTTSANWSDHDGNTGLGTNILEQIEYSVIALIIAAAIAFPLGLYIGHTGRGGSLLVGSVNATRALPSFGLMVLLFIILSPYFHGRSDIVYIVPVEIVLVLLAIPPILSNTYAGVQSVDPSIRDAAKGMGMTDRQVLFSVELPNAFPLIMSGLRSATLQVIATATVGAYIGLGGLGRPIYDGFQQGPFQDTDPSRAATGQLLAGALLVALLALAIDFILATIQRHATSRGITERYVRFEHPGITGTAPAPELSRLGVAH